MDDVGRGGAGCEGGVLASEPATSGVPAASVVRVLASGVGAVRLGAGPKLGDAVADASGAAAAWLFAAANGLLELRRLLVRSRGLVAAEGRGGGTADGGVAATEAAAPLAPAAGVCAATDGVLLLAKGFAAGAGDANGDATEDELDRVLATDALFKCSDGVATGGFVIRFGGTGAGEAGKN